MTEAAIEPMRIEVPGAILEDLRARLANTRWPDQLPDTAWSYGTDLGYLRELCSYWLHDYDWRAQEERLNAFDHFQTTIDGQRVHFVHAPSPQPDALPLVMTHGWPGSVIEFLEVIEPLRDPAAHGGDPADAFHVVCPSLPGYAWSGPTTEPGWDVRRVAEAWAELMARLGYGRYGAQGGDWGALVSAQLGLVDSEHLAGIHLNMAVAGPPEDGGPPLTHEEQLRFARAAEYLESGSGYAEIQGTKPQTLAYGLTDSPAGLAGWIVEKFHAWCDHDGDVESAVSRDALLTNLMVYWTTHTINSSTRLYCETKRAGRWGPPTERVDVPTAVAVYPAEILQAPRAWVEALYDVRHWAEMPRGGHFAALEEPGLFVTDVREAFRTLR